MSLAIDVNNVVSLLIGGERMFVKSGTFTLDAYEFRFGDGDFAGSGLGYGFQTVEGGRYYGPIEATQMVEVSG